MVNLSQVSVFHLPSLPSNYPKAPVKMLILQETEGSEWVCSEKGKQSMDPINML